MRASPRPMRPAPLDYSLCQRLYWHRPTRQVASVPSWGLARTCENAEVPDPMSDVVEARKAYEQAQEDARALVERARRALGEAVHNARGQGISQDAIAKELGLTREQVRRFQREYEDASRAGGSIEYARLVRMLKAWTKFSDHATVASACRVIVTDEMFMDKPGEMFME